MTKSTKAGAAAARKIAAGVENDDGDLTILMRIKNNRLDYTVLRPDATMSGITDAVLVAGLIEAGSTYKFKRRKKSANTAREALRGSETISYQDRVIIRFGSGVISSTRDKKTTLQALSVVVQNLARDVAATMEPTQEAKDLN